MPHWKKQSCLGPHVRYIVTHNHKKNLIMFQVNLQSWVGLHTQPSWLPVAHRPPIGHPREFSLSTLSLESLRLLPRVFSIYWAPVCHLVPKPMPRVLSFHFSSTLVNDVKNHKHLFCSQIWNLGRARQGQLVSAECGTSKESWTITDYMILVQLPYMADWQIGVSWQMPFQPAAWVSSLPAVCVPTASIPREKRSESC